MKRGKLLKGLFLASSCLIAMPLLSSCNSFFGGDEGTLIKEIATDVKENGDTEVTITFMDEEREPVVFIIPKGQDGETGENGNGIASVSQKMSEDGNSLIITFTFTDGSEPKIIEVPVVKGQDGTSIKNITTSLDEEGNTVVTVSFEGGMEDVSFTIPKAEKGEPGNGIANIEVTLNEDGSQTITISYTDPNFENTIVTVPAPEKGEDGKGIDFILTSESDTEYILTFYFTDGSSQDVSFAKPTQPATWLSGFSKPETSIGNNGDFYLDKSTLTIYQKVNGEWMLIAELSQDSLTHTVKFDANGGEFSSDTFSTIFEVNHGETFYGNANYIFPKVTREGYTFIGWHTSINQSDPTAGIFTDLTPVLDDMTLYAWWEVVA